MLCPNCGKNNKDGEAFCTNCGAALAKVKAQKNVQKAVDAYSKPSGRTNQKNVVSAIIVVFLSLILVITLVLLAPLVTNMLDASDKPDDDTSVQIPTDDPDNKEADFTANPYYACYRAHDEYVFPNSSSVYLSRSDLKDLTKEELTVALSEIYARHGERFRDADLQAYFDNRSWYAATSSTSQLNTYEVANEILLQVYIAQQSGTFSQPGNPYLNEFTGTDSFAVRNSQSRYLDAEDLKDLNEDQLIIARNEIYARHGFVFSDEELQTYFCTKSWYVPVGTVFSESSFNEFESNNIKLIEIYERKQEGVTFSEDNPYMDYFYSNPGDYILSDSDSQELQDHQLAKFEDDQCVLARNEIYARHGYVFNDEELLEYFLQQSWYEPGGKIGDTGELSLSGTEKKNIEILQDAESILSAMPEIDQLNHTPSVTVSADMFQLQIPAYWKDYGVYEVGGDFMQFYEKLSKNSILSMEGRLIRISAVPMDSEQLQGEYTKLGVLTDINGTQWELIATGPTDVQSHGCAAALYNAMRQDLRSIYATITPGEGYTYTAY